MINHILENHIDETRAYGEVVGLWGVKKNSLKPLGELVG